jgi:leucyl aminopeptidase
MFEDYLANALKYLPEVKFENASENGASLVVIVEKNTYKERIAGLCKEHGGVIAKALEQKEFKAEFNESFAVFPANLTGGKCARIVLISLGDVAKLSEQRYYKDSAQKIGGAVSNLANGLKLGKICLEFMFESEKKNCIVNQILFGISLRNYRFDEYFVSKKDGKEASLKEVCVLNYPNVEKLQAKVNEYRRIAENILLVRHLVNTPPSVLNPEYYADLVESSFEHGFLDSLFNKENIAIKVLTEDDMKALGMNGALAVGQGSNKESRVVVIEYRGNSSSDEFDLALVGKGVTFDSGGLSIKPAQSMEDMKCDMAGSATVFAAIRLFASLKMGINAVAVMGIVENSVDAHSFKPGDIVKTMSGQTIEVLNTDAEGRVVLADCLYYAQTQYKPKNMLDLATLTGAITIALGDVYCGLFSPCEDFASQVLKSAQEASEKMWAFPMGDEFDEMINSLVADVKNIGSGRGAGSITAAQFLGRFVNYKKDVPATKWAHLDIAGVAFLGKSGTPVSDKGATGWGLLTLYKFAQSLRGV